MRPEESYFYYKNVPTIPMKGADMDNITVRTELILGTTVEDLISVYGSSEIYNQEVRALMEKDKIDIFDAVALLKARYVDSHLHA